MWNFFEKYLFCIGGGIAIFVAMWKFFTARWVLDYHYVALWLVGGVLLLLIQFEVLESAFDSLVSSATKHWKGFWLGASILTLTLSVLCPWLGQKAMAWALVSSIIAGLANSKTARNFGTRNPFLAIALISLLVFSLLAKQDTGSLGGIMYLWVLCLIAGVIKLCTPKKGR